MTAMGVERGQIQADQDAARAACDTQQCVRQDWACKVKLQHAPINREMGCRHRSRIESTQRQRGEFSCSLIRQARFREPSASERIQREQACAEGEDHQGSKEKRVRISDVKLPRITKD